MGEDGDVLEKLMFSASSVPMYDVEHGAKRDSSCRPVAAERVSFGKELLVHS